METLEKLDRERMKHQVKETKAAGASTSAAVQNNLAITHSASSESLVDQSFLVCFGVVVVAVCWVASFRVETRVHVPRSRSQEAPRSI